MPRSGINEALYQIVADPPEWVMELNQGKQEPYFLTKHVALIEGFLSATTDSVRLVHASRVSSEILKEYDMAELEELRATIQTSELLRVIPYAKQTDHSAHTLYLYLLGVYLFFAYKPIREGFARFLGVRDDSRELVERFLFRWVFVSLLHDVGYIFHGRARSEIRAVDRMFRASAVKSLLKPADAERYGATITDAIRDIKIRPFEPIQNPEDMLTALREMPWGESIDFDLDIFETFTVHVSRGKEITANNLEDFAYRVASSGYDGFSAEGTVDHAVASGLFLFRYSTFWYWLAKKCRFDGPFAAFQHDYDKLGVAHACFATAAHNLISAHAAAFNRPTFDNDPFLYLGILCDELQKWDRFPAGERYIVDLESFAQHCTDSEHTRVEGAWDGPKVIVRFDEAELGKSVNGALGRLSAAGDFIDVYPKPPKFRPAAEPADQPAPNAEAADPQPAGAAPAATPLAEN